MTFEKLARIVADDFKATMQEEGFSTFDDMRKCYWWEWSDVRDEVRAIIDEAAKDYGESFWMADDGTFIQIGACRDMSWRDFKKLLLAELEGKQ